MNLQETRERAQTGGLSKDVANILRSCSLSAARQLQNSWSQLRDELEQAIVGGEEP